ncbi:MAG: YcxB family protein [Polyangiaceae bacterium]
MRLLIGWVAVVAVAVPAFLYLSLPDTLGAGMLLAIPIVVLVLGNALFMGRTRWANAGLQGLDGKTAVYLFDDYGYQFKAPGRESRVEWAALHHHLETEAAFLIYFNAMVVTVIPKHAFAPTEQARLRAELAARIARPKSPGKQQIRKLVLLWLLLVATFLIIWQVFGGE